MMKHLTKEDFNVILESLKYSKKTFEEYTGYPSAEFKAQRIESVNNVVNLIRQELKDWDES